MRQILYCMYGLVHRAIPLRLVSSCVGLKTRPTIFHELKRERNEKTMSKAKPATRVDDMRAEYSLDYSKAKPNRFASKLADTSAVVLQPDVAAVFKSSDAVSAFLRSAILATSKPRTVTRAKTTRKAA